MPHPKLFDPACRTLAEHFLQDEPGLQRHTDELAAELQQCVEDWLDWIHLLTERAHKGAHV